MPVTLPAVSAASLLVTPEELEAAALESLQLDITVAADLEQVTLALFDAEARVNRYLSRTLFVRALTQYGLAWKYDGNREAYVAPIKDWPYVEAETSSGITVADHGLASPTARTVSVTTLPVSTLALVAFVGYRGRQHTLDGAAGTTDITSLTGLSTLATLPEQVPSDIRRAIIEVTLLFLNRARNRTLGISSRVQQIGSGVSQVIESADPQAEGRILARIANHRRVTV